MPVGPYSVEQLGELVRERRAREGLSLRQAAATSHVSFNTLARVERGRVPDLTRFAKSGPKRWASKCQAALQGC
jgi:predicted transcriptional regulator